MCFKQHLAAQREFVMTDWSGGSVELKTGRFSGIGKSEWLLASLL